MHKNTKYKNTKYIEIQNIPSKGCDQSLIPPLLPPGISILLFIFSSFYIPFLSNSTFFLFYTIFSIDIFSSLSVLTKRDAVYHWAPECQDAFVQLKHLLTTAPITVFPDFGLPFQLYTDASTLGLGASLAQVQEGREQIICCALCALSQTEKNYPATKLECLTTVWATAKLRPYLMVNKFDIYTDHYALQRLKSMRFDQLSSIAGLQRGRSSITYFLWKQWNKSIVIKRLDDYLQYAIK